MPLACGRASDGDPPLHRGRSTRRAQELCKLIASFVSFVHAEIADVQAALEASPRGGAPRAAADAEAEVPAAPGLSRSASVGGGFASELSLELTHLLRKAKQVYLEGFDVRSVSSATDSAALR